MLSDTDIRILEILQEDSRISLKDLAARVSLSSPSVSERIRRLVDRGIIRSFTVDIDPRAFGYELQAIVRIRPLPGKRHLVQKMIEEIPQFGECDKVTGDDYYIGRLYIRSMEQLDEILGEISDNADTSSSIVKSQPIRRRLPPFG